MEPTFGRVRTERRCGFRRWWRGVGRSLPAPRRLRRNVPTAGRDNTAMRCGWHTPFWWQWDASRMLDGLLVAVLSHRLIRSLCSLRRLPFLRQAELHTNSQSNNRYPKSTPTITQRPIQSSSGTNVNRLFAMTHKQTEKSDNSFDMLLKGQKKTDNNSRNSCQNRSEQNRNRMRI